MKQNIKSSLVWAVILLAAMVMGFLISIAINRRADATLHTDYAENIYNRPLINWKVAYWLDTGDEVGDTVFVAVDTTTAGGEYTLELASNRYLISAFPLWGDATDSTGSRRQWVKEEVVVVAVLDTFSFPFVNADSGFIGDITGDIVSVAKLTVSDTATFNGHAQHNATITVGVDDTGYDVNCYGDTTGSRLFWDSSKKAFRIGGATGTQWHTDSTGEYSFAGGWNNKAIGGRSFIGSGSANVASGFSATVIGGEDNRATASYAAVSGGDHNEASGEHASVSGGQANWAMGLHSYVGGGTSDSATGTYAVVSGGIQNRAEGWAATVPGGNLNKAHGSCSFAGGRAMRVNGAGSFGWGLSSAGEIVVDNAYVFIVGGATEYKMGINTVSPEEALHVSGDIKADTVKAAFKGNVVGDLTGTADHATTASTCTTWTGSGTVNDSLAAIRTDVVNLDATVSTHGDSLTAHKTDIAALQATKVDTSWIVYADSYEISEGWVNATRVWGSSTAKFFAPTDTIKIVAVTAGYRLSTTGGAWQFLVQTGADTIACSDTLTAAGYNNWIAGSLSNTTITPAAGVWFTVKEITDGMALSPYCLRIEFYYINP